MVSCLDGGQVVELSGDVNGRSSVGVEPVDVGAGAQQRLNDHLVAVLRGQRQRTLAGLEAPASGERSTAVRKTPHRYANSHAIWDHTVLGLGVIGYSQYTLPVQITEMQYLVKKTI